jgi:hypothetical protein
MAGKQLITDQLLAVPAPSRYAHNQHYVKYNMGRQSGSTGLAPLPTP